MTTADIAILCTILLPTLFGVIYGFLNIIFSLLTWLISIGLAVHLTPYLSASPYLINYIDRPEFRVIAAFVLLFIFCLLILSVLSYFVIKILGKTGLRAADRILGLFFGMGLGVIIVSVVVFLAGFTPLPEEVWWKESRLIDPFVDISLWGSSFLGESVTEYQLYEKIEKND
tara:strand:- start:639 stop:1154 length:516 start_codon:yes stop_codon:yes gene_type:complete